MSTLAFLAIAKATFVCGVALFLSRLCRRGPASIRHLLFVLAFAALVVIPVAGRLLPIVPITVAAGPMANTPRPSQDAPNALSSAGADASTSRAVYAAREVTVRGSEIVAALVVTLWLFGAAIFVLPVVAGLWQVRRLRQMASPCLGARDTLHALVAMLGIRRAVDVLIHETVTSPMTCGVLKPVVLLPASAEQWNETSLRCALRHELEHVARWDFLIHCSSRVVCAAYWFHPLVWATWRRLRLEAERTCDAAVLEDVDPAEYASLLVSIARREPADRREPILAMAGRDDLAARVTAVLRGDHARGRADRRLTAAVIAAGAIVILSVTSITVVRALPQTQPTSAALAPLRFEMVSVERNERGDKSLMYFTEDADGRPGSRDGRVQWFRATNTNARFLIWSAYGFGNSGIHHIDNAPGWVESDCYDILAKAPSPVAPEQMREMLQAFVAEHFKLMAHRGSREFPAYAILLARTDVGPGPRMTPSQLNCTATPGVSSPCGLAGASGRLTGRGVTMAQLAAHLPKQIGGSQVAINGRLIDSTGLTGTFDFDLEWTPDPVARQVPATNEITGAPEYRPFVFPNVTNAPNFMAALQDQLGLRIDEVPFAEPVLVIDKIERPE